MASRKTDFLCTLSSGSIDKLPYLSVDRPHFFPEKMGYKRFDTLLICKRSHRRALNWRFNVRFQLLLTYNT